MREIWDLASSESHRQAATISAKFWSITCDLGAKQMGRRIGKVDELRSLPAILDSFESSVAGLSRALRRKLHREATHPDCKSRNLGSHHVPVGERNRITNRITEPTKTCCMKGGDFRKLRVVKQLTKSGRHKTRTCDLYGVNVAL